MKVSAVVVTYNRKVLLEECLDAILNQSFPVSEVIVIDNCSTDGTDELINKKYKSISKLIYTKLKENIGGAGGFYTGMRQAFERESDFIWIMDDDTIPTEECLEKLMNAFDKDASENVSFMASSIFGVNGEAMNVPKISRRKDDSGYSLWGIKLNNKLIEIESATFVSLLFNAKACGKCGLPWPNFFIWGDDTEYTLRLTRNFGPAYLVGDSIAIHKRNGSGALSIIKEENSNRINMYFYLYRNSLIYSHEYGTSSEVIKWHLKIFVDILKCLVKSDCKFRWLKVKVLMKAWFNFIFKKYDKSSFNSRMKMTFDY